MILQLAKLTAPEIVIPIPRMVPPITNAMDFFGSTVFANVERTLSNSDLVGGKRERRVKLTSPTNI
jgi:hypothetical protein